MVDWSPEPLEDLSEASEDTLDDEKDEDVGEVVRQAQVHCSASGSASTFIKDLGKVIEEAVKEHLDAKGSEKEQIETM